MWFTVFLHTLDGVRRHSLAAYFILANVITWLCMLPKLVNTSRPEKSLLIISSLAVYGPLLAALLVTWASGGLPDLRDFWHRIIKWRVGIQWYLVVFMLPLIPNIVVLGIGLLFADSFQDDVNSPSQLRNLILLLPYQFLTNGLEEPGWRGYALPKLQEKYTAFRASWILGVFWAMWHLPQMIATHTMTMIDSGFIIATVLMSAARILSWTFVFTWVYNNTESVLLAILLHSWVNTVDSYILTLFPHPLVPVTQVFVGCVLALFLVLRVFRGGVSCKSAG